MIYDREELIKLFAHQAKNFYNKNIDITPYIDRVIERIDIGFSHSANKYYGKNMKFSPLHSGQYCMFLHGLSKVLSIQGDIEGADVAYCLNKALHAVDMYHGIELPEIYGVEHPVGTVIGRGGGSVIMYFSIKDVR